MPTYVYGLLPVNDERPSVAPSGLDGAPVRMVRAGAVDVLASDVAETRPTPSIERIRAHDAVLRWALERQTPLPARFGQTFGTDEALIDAVGERQAHFLDALARVRGLVEMTVRAGSTVNGGEPAPVARGTGSSGRAYLERVRARVHADRAWLEKAGLVQQRVSDAVRDLARAEVRSASTRPSRAVTISHLVERGAVARYRAALRALDDGHPELRLAITGPWAPYSFAEVGRG